MIALADSGLWTGGVPWWPFAVAGIALVAAILPAISWSRRGRGDDR